MQVTRRCLWAKVRQTVVKGSIVRQSVVCYLRQHRALCCCQLSRCCYSSHVDRQDEVCCALRHIPPPQYLKEAPRSIRRVVS